MSNKSMNIHKHREKDGGQWITVDLITLGASCRDHKPCLLNAAATRKTRCMMHKQIPFTFLDSQTLSFWNTTPEEITDLLNC